MGVSGVGKSTVMAALADRLGWPTLEGDALHPPANVAKMAAGEPLSDADREPWLDLIAAWIGDREREGTSSIVTCSALRRAYRDRLRRGHPSVWVVHLVAPTPTVAGPSRGVFGAPGRAAAAGGGEVARRPGPFHPPGALAAEAGAAGATRA